MSTSLVWFRLDLRLEDNPALLAAVAAGGPVIPVYIWSSEEEEPWPPGTASRRWRRESLRKLAAALEARGSRLIMRRGPSLRVLNQLISETGATAVFWNRRYEPAAIARDTAVKKALRDRGIRAESFHECTLFAPGTLRPLQVFTAFWRACLKEPEPSPPEDAPAHIAAPSAWPESDSVEDGPALEGWTPGEDGARAALDIFVRDALDDYATGRDRPDLRGTSRLSPHLHFGEISPRAVWHAAHHEMYRRELGWREFAYHLLFQFPKTTNAPLRPDFAGFPWRTDRKQLAAWQRGMTGYPLVDAGMRELLATGWMHNRVRMVVASFLTKHLRIHWEEGAYWFWDKLLDADLANNTLGWQWTAGCGADAAPYFRIFNPSRQAERFDPDGAYVRRWVPEAGTDAYPAPIVDHKRAREEALAAFAEMRAGPGASRGDAGP